MGVRGLTQLLRSKCPDLFASLPYRLYSLQGQRIVIDGNMYMMKFHHRPDKTAGSRRYLKPWYLLVNALWEKDVSAICVFDGNERHPGKEKKLPFVASTLAGIGTPDILLVAQPTSLGLIQKKILSLNTQVLEATSVSTSDSLLPQDKASKLHILNIAEDEIWRGFIQSLGKALKMSTSALHTLTAHCDNESEKLKRRVSGPDDSVYGECIELLEAMGIPCIVATGHIEAEALASSLVLNGHADYVASEDNDVLVYGSPMVTNLVEPTKLETISWPGQPIHDALGLSKESFIDLAILLGCDFAPNSPFSVALAYRLIKGHATIENVADAMQHHDQANSIQKSFTSTEGYMEQVHVARDIFRALPPTPGPSIFKASEWRPDLTEEIMSRHLAKKESHAGQLLPSP